MDSGELSTLLAHKSSPCSISWETLQQNTRDVTLCKIQFHFQNVASISTLHIHTYFPRVLPKKSIAFVKMIMFNMDNVVWTVPWLFQAFQMQLKCNFRVALGFVLVEYFIVCVVCMQFHHFLFTLSFCGNSCKTGKAITVIILLTYPFQHKWQACSVFLTGSWGDFLWMCKLQFLSFKLDAL